jgi:hypothetical protein
MRRSKSGEKKFRTIKKTKSQIAKPNREVDHRQLRFDFQPRSPQEVAIQKCGSSRMMDSLSSSSTTSPSAALSFTFLSLSLSL